MSESNIIGPVKCFTVVNGAVQEGIKVYGDQDCKAISLFHQTVHVDETESGVRVGDRLIWANVVHSGGELKILPCEPPEAWALHSFQMLVSVFAYAETRPLYEYNNDQNGTRILRTVQTFSYANTFDYGVQLLALLGWHDKITVYESKPGAPRESRSFSEAWSVSGTELFENF